MKPGHRLSASSSSSSAMSTNIDKLLALDHEDVKMGRGRYPSDPTHEPGVSNTNRQRRGGGTPLLPALKKKKMQASNIVE